MYKMLHYLVAYVMAEAVLVKVG